MRPKSYNDLNISWAIRDIPADIISKDDRAFLFILLSIIGNNKSILRTIPQFSQKFGISCRAISRTTKSLNELKFIQIIRPYNQGRGQANEYFLNYENIVRASKLIHKHDYMASLTEISSPIGHALDAISSPNLQKKHALLANHRYIKKERKERESTREKRAPLSASFLPNQKMISLLKEVTIKSGKTEDQLLTKFKNIQKSKNAASEDFNLELENFLLNERPMGYTNGHANGNGESKSAVRFLDDPSHPNYETLKQIRERREALEKQKEEVVEKPTDYVPFKELKRRHELSLQQGELKNGKISNFDSSGSSGT